MKIGLKNEEDKGAIRLEVSDCCFYCVNKGGCEFLVKIKEIDLEMYLFTVFCEKQIKPIKDINYEQKS